MKILQECRKGTLKIIKPDIDAILPYRMYTYCDTCKVRDYFLLFNFVTGEVLCLDNSDFTVDIALPFPDISSLKPACREYLLSHRFIVNETNEDWRDVEEIRHIMKLWDQVSFEGFEKFEILTTTDCNARCYYCFEKDAQKIAMDEKTAEDTADFILRNCSRTGKKEVRLSWFGGEPLYNDKVIDIICRKLTDAGIGISSSMISNGLLLNAEMCKKAADLWKLKKVQITLDGTEEIYNKTKAYVGSVTNPFETVISNIQSAMDSGIRVIIRLNVSEYNIENLYLLADELAERFSCKKPSVYVYILFQYNSEKYIQRKKELEEKLEKLKEKLKTLGLSCGREFSDTDFLNGNDTAVNGGIRIYQCQADNPYCVVIFPDGRLLSCENFDDAHMWGSIYKDEDKYSARFQFPSTNRKMSPFDYWSECKAQDTCQCCRLFPFCGKLLHCPNQTEECDPVMKERILHSVEAAKQHYIRNFDRLLTEVSYMAK